MDIHRSARKHGVADDDIRHAVTHHVVADEIGDDPTRVLYLGPDRATRMLEIVTIVRTHDELAIHAMVMRAKYRRMLTKGR